MISLRGTLSLQVFRSLLDRGRGLAIPTVRRTERHRSLSREHPGRRSSQNDVNHDQTSSGVQVQGQVVEQVLGGVAHEL